MGRTAWVGATTSHRKRSTRRPNPAPQRTQPTHANRAGPHEGDQGRAQAKGQEGPSEAEPPRAPQHRRQGNGPKRRSHAEENKTRTPQREREGEGEKARGKNGDGTNKNTAGGGQRQHGPLSDPKPRQTDHPNCPRGAKRRSARGAKEGPEENKETPRPTDPRGGPDPEGRPHEKNAQSTNGQGRGRRGAREARRANGRRAGGGHLFRPRSH